ncbi:MAG: PepSY domain-containing protein [Gammaproteobacteria bacterium]|nr:PepSY domain-containing protein [Gammaproteobacteria bacterium]
MNKTVATQSALGIAAVTLLVTLAQADSKSDRLRAIDALELDLTEAAALATESNPGNIIEAEFEVEDDRGIWEIEIVNAANQTVSVEVDGLTGEILASEIEDDDDERPLNLTDTINLETAINVVKAIESGAVIEAELEDEHGELVWEVEALNANQEKIKVHVNAYTGEVLI